MSMIQQDQAPNPPGAKAPAAPAQPGQAGQAGTQADQARQAADLKRQVDDQIRQATEQARAAGRQARDAAREAARAAGQASTPVIAQSSDLPFDPNNIKPMVEYLGTALFITIACVVVLFPFVRALARRLEPRPVAPPIPPQVVEQLKRIEHGVESMAVEIERISESQRFMAKLQAAKGEPVALPPRSASGA